VSWNEETSGNFENKRTVMSTQNDQDFKVELEPPRFENGKAILIAGLRERPETLAAIPDQWRRAMAYRIPNQVGRASYGLNFNCLSDTDAFEYLAGVEVSGFSGLPSELSRLTIPPQKYAVFTHREHVSKLWYTCDRVGKWLPQSGYEHPGVAAGVPDFFERYGEDFDPKTGTGSVEVWVPVRKMRAENAECGVRNG
jgi:AraC family transcriptional regulator